MKTKWLEIGKTVIFRDISKGGLLAQFLKDYKVFFGGSINPSCMKCLNSYYTNYLNSLKMSDKIKCDYILFAKYNGIQFGFNKSPIRNANLTNEIAEMLLKEHPRGEKLFLKIPAKITIEEPKKARKKRVVKIKE